MEAQLQALQDQLMAQQALIQALQAGQAQAQVPQPLAPAIVPPPGPFALTPALAMPDVVDLSTSTGIKLYKKITEPLETPFDGTPSKLSSFLDNVSQRARDSGWNATILRISNQSVVNPQVYHLVTHHRLLTIENVRANAMTYVGQPIRAAQDAAWMYEFIRDSLTENAKVRLAVEKDKFMINDYPDGPSYLKALLIKFFVETTATNYYLRESLSLLPTKIKDLKSDIAKFNDHVDSIVMNLAAGGETSSDLIVYLFKSYLLVEDKAFNQFILNKKEKFDEGDPTITTQALMDSALNKYNTLRQSKAWKAKTPEEERLIALTAQLKEARDKITELAKKKGSSTKAGNNKDTTKQDSEGTDPKKQKNLDPWRTERKGNEMKLEKDDKTYHWCTHHGYWCEHETKDCRAKKKADAKKSGKQSGTTQSTKEKEKEKNMLKLAKAFAAISEPAEATDDESE